MTGEAASHHMPYGTFLQTKCYPRKASRCISVTQYKAGKVMTGEAASHHMPYGTFLQTKCYPQSRNGQSLKMWELPTCFTAISPETHGHWHSSGGWAKETGWPLEAHGFFSHMEAFSKTQYPKADTKQLAKASTPDAGTKQLAKLNTPEQPIITYWAGGLPKTRYITLTASPHTPYWPEPARHPWEIPAGFIQLSGEYP